VSALVIPGTDERDAAVELTAELMHSYHNVAELRLIRGTAYGVRCPARSEVVPPDRCNYIPDGHEPPRADPKQVLRGKILKFVNNIVV
jgi:hypothetical protein